MKCVVYGTLLTALLLGSVAIAAPVPAVVQKGGLVTADVSFEPLKPFFWQLTPDMKPVRYWYTILTITNKSRQDMDFYAHCDLLTDTFQIIPGYERVPMMIQNALIKRHAKKYPLLQTINSVGNRLLQGEDHAVDVLVVWRDFGPKVEKVSLYITGLSNETAVVNHPTLKDVDGNPTPIYLRKTLELNYDLHSENPKRTQVDVKFKSKRWVMR